MRKVIFYFLILFLNQITAQEISCNNKKSLPQGIYPAALNLRSDTVDILKYNISLEITDFTNKLISGNTIVTLNPKLNNISTVSFDLLRLTIDSVKLSSTTLSYSYNDTLLIVNLPAQIHAGDTTDILIAYHGTPQGDASGWGGFYFQSGYAFNLGVGFAADPHNYGRVWFPCFDNFVERSKYEFNITTNLGKVAYCNGYLAQDSLNLAGFRKRKWLMDEEIPTYLASVAVAGYTHVNKTYNSINGTIPGYLTALPADTTNMKNSFVNLQSALDAYEGRYGLYRWNRIGFCLVPFSSGAMEHATNIAYPRVAANGSLTYETLMAHEFSHHWWGDLVTCRTQEDMWINEGMANFSEHIFLEWKYGRSQYNNAVRSNHEEVVRYLQAREGGYRAISGIPHEHTYGDHVYKKGASVAHSMRGYLGDSIFFSGLKNFLSGNIRKDVSSFDFMNSMQSVSGPAQISMTDFFNDWVFNPGFPHFSIDSFSTISNGSSYDVIVYLKQKLRGAPSYYNNVPLDITFKSQNWQEETRKITLSGQTANFTITNVPFEPAIIMVDRNDLLNDALVAEEKVIKTTGIHNLIMGKWNMNVSSISDSAFVRVEHNYVAPDQNGVPLQYRISQERFWRVDGIFPAGFVSNARITYDGRNNTSGGSGQLDNQLINASEDSLIVLYRKDRSENWTLYSYFTKSPGANLNDRFGTILLDSIKAGEYALAMKDLSSTSINQTVKKPGIKIYPNPASDYIQFETLITGIFELFDIKGNLCLTGKTSKTNRIPRGELADGLYFLKISDGQKTITSKIILEK